jgi:hypothetical protein
MRDQTLTNLIAFSFGASTSPPVLLIGGPVFAVGPGHGWRFALFASYLGWMAFVMGMVGGYVTRYQQ